MPEHPRIRTPHTSQQLRDRVLQQPYPHTHDTPTYPALSSTADTDQLMHLDQFLNLPTAPPPAADQKP